MSLLRPRPCERIYVGAALLLGAFVAARALDAAFTGSPGPAHAAAVSVGRPRDVDMERLRELIRGGDLSDREALFAHPVDEPPPAR